MKETRDLEPTAYLYRQYIYYITLYIYILYPIDYVMLHLGAKELILEPIGVQKSQVEMPKCSRHPSPGAAMQGMTSMAGEFALLKELLPLGGA